MVEVNYLAIFVASILSMVIGSLWFGPIFGKPWMKEMGLTKDGIDKKMKAGEMNKLYGIQFIASLIMAYILSHALVFAKAYLGTSGVGAGITTGFFNWLGFIAPTSLAGVLWEGKSWKLWIINNSYYLTLLVAMGVLLSVWM